jgi:PAS domain S-box-containing protein
MGIWTWDAASGVQTRDANLNRLLGLEAVASTQPMEDFFARVHSGDRSAVRAEFLAAASRGTGLAIEFRVVWPDGTVRWLRDQGDTIGGGGAYLTGAVLDVTDRREAQEALRASEARLGAIFSRAAVGLSEVSLDGRFLRVNDELCRMLGWSRRDLLEGGVADVTHPDDMPSALAAVARVVETGEPVSLDKRCLRSDGTAVFTNNTLTRLVGPGGRAGAVLAVTVDLTDRRRAETAVRESEERLRLIVESATDYAILTLDPDRAVTSWSPGAEAVFGYAEAEIVGRSADLLFTPEDRAAGAPGAEAEAARRDGRAADERWHVRKDGSRFYASGVLTPLRTGVGFVKVARDLTERKRTEDALRDARDRLEARVAERTAELSEVVAELRTEIAARADLARRLATAQEDERRRVARDLHDSVGQLLAALALAVKAVSAAGDLPTGAADRLAEVERVAELLGKEAHALAVRLRPTSLDDIGLEAALGQLVSDWSARIGVRADFHATGLDPGRLPSESETTLYRVVQEALTNVARHARATRVSVVVSRQGGHATAVIEDDGAGFDPGAVPNGRLGLLGMRERAGLAGGEMDIESSRGSGTTVVVRIPVGDDGGNES